MDNRGDLGVSSTWGIALVALILGASGELPDPTTNLPFAANNADTGALIATYADYLDAVNLCVSTELEPNSYPAIPNDGDVPWALLLVWVPPVTGIAVEEPVLPLSSDLYAPCGRILTWEARSN